MLFERNLAIKPRLMLYLVVLLRFENKMEFMFVVSKSQKGFGVENKKK